MEEDRTVTGTVKYPTCSQFTGTRVNERMEGKGEYVFPSGTKYVGEFKDGTFNGKGTLYFTNGGCFEAEWVNGQAVGDGSGGDYIFKDKLVFHENQWSYSELKDRRFYSEICHGIEPAGRTQLTDNNAHPAIPLGWYDCGDGIYNPNNRVVYNYEHKYLRNADTDEHDWIVSSCRKGVTDEEQF